MSHTRYFFRVETTEEHCQNEIDNDFSHTRDLARDKFKDRERSWRVLGSVDRDEKIVGELVLT